MGLMKGTVSDKKQTIAAAPTMATLKNLPGVKRGRIPIRFRPQLATLSDEVPAGNDWLHETKFDGYRLLAFLDGENVRLVTRNGNDWTSRFQTIADALRATAVERAILDGEVVSLAKNGLSSFQELQNVLRRGNERSLVYYVFDAPYMAGYDLRGTPLLDRKQVLASLLLAANPNNEGAVRYSDHIRGNGQKVLASACRHGMEGIVSKRANSVYQQSRSQGWLKIKCLKRQEFVIGGYTKPSGSRIGFGALLVGYYQAKRLIFAGRVGTGFTSTILRQLTSALRKLRIESAPFANPPTGAEARGVTWVRPELVGEVAFTEWTNDGLLRHPSFQGLREDKPPRQIIREDPKNRAKQEPDARRRRLTINRAATKKNVRRP